MRILTSTAGILLLAGLFISSGPLALFLGAGRLIEAWAEIYQANWQRNGQARLAAITSSLRTASILLLLVLLPNIEVALLIHLPISLAILLALEFAPQRHTLNFDSTVIPPMIRRGLVLGVVLFLQALQANTPRLALEHWGSPAALGLFATLSVILQTGNLVASSYGQSLLPRFTAASLPRTAFWVALPGLMAATLLLPLYAVRAPLSQLLTGSSTAASQELLLALALAQILVWPAAVSGCVLTAHRLYRQQFWLTLSLNAVSLAATLLLVPRFGAVGAAFALAASSAVMLLATAVLVSLQFHPIPAAQGIAAARQKEQTA